TTAPGWLQHDHELRILEHEAGELLRGRVALRRVTTEEMRVAHSRWNVVATDGYASDQRSRIGVEYETRANPPLDLRSGIELRDLVGLPGNEVVVERGVVKLDHVRDLSR